jgi:peptide/nickel transport system ATP-binding protein
VTGTPALEVVDLRVELEDAGDEERIDIVDEVSFHVDAGEVLGLVGESGSGKTTVGLAVLGHTRRGVRVTGGDIRIEGRSILQLGKAERQGLRGELVSYVPQDPASALNPALRIGTQLMETLSEHGFGASGAERRARITEALGEVLLPSDDAFLKRYPHQLSGGQQQRVTLAMAFANRPRVIVLDEPTTGLDVTTQAHVLETVRDLCGAHGVAALYVSHDLAVVATLSGRVAVMYAGRIVEVGPKSVLFRASAHPYARRLVEAIPELSGEHALVGIAGTAPRPGHRPQGCFFAPRCAYVVERCRVDFPPVEPVADGHVVRCWEHARVLADSLAARPDAVPLPELRPEEPLVAATAITATYGFRQVLFDVDLVVRPHECVALVGESGSGKTTFARCLAGLHTTYAGEVLFRGKPLPAGARARDRETRRAIQYVFQSPYSSLNPRKTIGQILAQPLRLFFEGSGREARRRAVKALGVVQLGDSVLTRYPHQLSGGERQRVAIARALVASPQLLICDEVTSALDVSVQAAIVDLLAELQRELGLGLLFVTHNLALIRTIAQEVVVMREGRVVERGLVDSVLDAPQAPYTKQLLSDTPSLEAAMAAAT